VSPVEEQIRRILRDERAKDPSFPSQARSTRLRNIFSVASPTSTSQNSSTRSPAKALSIWTCSKLNSGCSKRATSGVSKPLARDRIEAAENVVMMDLALLSAEIANGVYKKPIDAIVKEYQYEPLPQEIRIAAIACWKRGGLLPAEVIEEMVPQTE
jgi:hypothetical protein